MEPVRSDQAKAEPYDLIVIGGGINGAAIAHEASLSGLRVVLLERDDLCCGTSSAATRLVHGGLRYLEYAELGLVYESLHARERLLKTAPHLVEPLAFNIPVYRGGRRRFGTIRAGMYLYDLLSFGKSVPRHQIFSSDEMRSRFPGIAEAGLLGGARYFDARIRFPERMVVELLVDAQRHGAKVLTHTLVERIVVADGRVTGVECLANGKRFALSAAVTINAAGPWVDRLLGELVSRPLIGSTRGSHLVVDAADRLPREALYTEAQSDGRPFFIVPWNGMHLIGTTDVRDNQDPAAVAVTADEREYLLRETLRVYPGAGDLHSAVRYGYAGLRALPYRKRGAEGAITRRHIVHRHRNVERLYSIIGGKLTTHRALAEDVLSKVKKYFPGINRKIDAAQRPLPGAISESERVDLVAAIRQKFGAEIAERLVGIYGSRAMRVLELTSESEDLAKPIAPGANILVAELWLAYKEEWAQTLVDFLQRRCMAGLDANLGCDWLESVASWLVRLGLADQDEAIAQQDAYRDWIKQYRLI